MQFTDKVALVTGAGSGIGKATALLLARGGARVAVISRTADEIEATRAEIVAARRGHRRHRGYRRYG